MKKRLSNEYRNPDDIFKEWQEALDRLYDAKERKIDIQIKQIELKEKQLENSVKSPWYSFIIPFF